MTESEQSKLETAIGSYVREAILGLCSGKSQEELSETFVQQGFPQGNAENVVDFALLVAQHAIDIDEQTDSSQTAANLKDYAESAGFSQRFCDIMVSFAVEALSAIPTGDPDEEMDSFLREAGIDPDAARQMAGLAMLILEEEGASQEELVTGLVEAEIMPADDAAEFVDGVFVAKGFADQLRADVEFDTLAPSMMEHPPWITFIACELAR